MQFFSPHKLRFSRDIHSFNCLKMHQVETCPMVVILDLGKDSFSTES